MNSKELLEQIRNEDELPSSAGVVFKEILQSSGVQSIGYRKMRLIAEWLIGYLEMPVEEKDKVLQKVVS